jgi:hypothetical protein
MVKYKDESVYCIPDSGGSALDSFDILNNLFFGRREIRLDQPRELHRSFDHRVGRCDSRLLEVRNQTTIVGLIQTGPKIDLSRYEPEVIRAKPSSRAISVRATSSKRRRIAAANREWRISGFRRMGSRNRDSYRERDGSLQGTSQSRVITS